MSRFVVGIDGTDGSSDIGTNNNVDITDQLDIKDKYKIGSNGNLNIVALNNNEEKTNFFNQIEVDCKFDLNKIVFKNRDEQKTNAVIRYNDNHEQLEILQTPVGGQGADLRPGRLVLREDDGNESYMGFGYYLESDISLNNRCLIGVVNGLTKIISYHLMDNGDVVYQNKNVVGIQDLIATRVSYSRNECKR